MSKKIIIQYWPNHQSIYLNNAIVELFIETEKKFLLKTQNSNPGYLYLDILNIITRTELLKSVLNEFKELILDIIELNLSCKTVKKLYKKISIIFINRVLANLLVKLQHNKIRSKNIKINLDYNNANLIEYLLIYLIFGSSYIDRKVFLFEATNTPYHHVRILLENFIIQSANTTINILFNQLKYTIHINKFLTKYSLCNRLYSSNRSIVLFLNNLKWQRLIYAYIYETKLSYSERQKIFVISSSGIISKYIYIARKKQIKRLNQVKIIFILWLEIKDLMIPKIEKFIIQIIKYFLYCSINLISNTILILIKAIVIYLKK
uniref:Uncharacterized protein n=1 Tax=Polysiphonia sp. TaxID=1967842 RepID=A0A1Z1MT34_9FLOR|nr:hypothetical protein [Polysiphonia sp.]